VTDPLATVPSPTGVTKLNLVATAQTVWASVGVPSKFGDAWSRPLRMSHV